MKNVFLIFFVLQLFIAKAEIRSADTLRDQKNDYQYVDKKFDDVQKKLDEIVKNSNENIASAKQDVKDILNIYVGGAGVMFALIAFAINFFGKKAIKDRVEEIIAEAAQGQVDIAVLNEINSRITTELISGLVKEKSEQQLDVLLKNLETKGETTISQFQAKGNEVLNSIIAAPKRSINVDGQNIESSDEEINKLNVYVRANEFFGLAFHAKDQKVKIELYKNVLELQPNNSAALNNIGTAYNAIDRYQEAVDVLTKAIEADPLFDMAYGNRAHSYNLLNDFDSAFKDIEMALELNPKNDFAYAVKGNILTKQNKFIEAEESLNTAINLNPNSAEALFNRAYFYEERALFDKSEADYFGAEKNGFTNKALLYNNMAVLYRRQRQFDKAVDLLKKAREFNPDYPNIDGTLALVYADQNNDEEFYRYLNIALEKGCRVWNYLDDPGFDRYRNSSRLSKLIETYKRIS